MLRMEIALIIILTFVAFIYFSAGRKRSNCICDCSHNNASTSIEYLQQRRAWK